MFNQSSWAKKTTNTPLFYILCCAQYFIMETINVRWDVNTTSGSENITLEELECETMEEWNALDEDEQRERLQNALDELPERTYIIVDTWD